MKFELVDLKTPDALNEYCRRTLGKPQQRGSVMIYPCPFGTTVTAGSGTDTVDEQFKPAKDSDA
ncbi:hypothetical protein, partial [uncultured Akkermansia sp.]|uniref:hypothetical protein n=1 Tax=uncultured Akkermansia sp. TaxID=512294 RepID=UPI00262797DD